MALVTLKQGSPAHRLYVLAAWAVVAIVLIYVVFAYDVGALAMTFNYPLFIGQSGLEFWILNACLFAAWNAARGRPTRAAADGARHSHPARRPRTRRAAAPAAAEAVV